MKLRGRSNPPMCPDCGVDMEYVDGDWLCDECFVAQVEQDLTMRDIASRSYMADLLGGDG